MVWGFGVSLPMHVSCLGQLPGQLLLFFCEQNGCKLASNSCGSSEMRSVHSLELCCAETVAALGAAFLPSCGTGKRGGKTLHLQNWAGDPKAQILTLREISAAVTAGKWKPGLQKQPPTSCCKRWLWQWRVKPSTVASWRLGGGWESCLFLLFSSPEGRDGYFLSLLLWGLTLALSCMWVFRAGDQSVFFPRP